MSWMSFGININFGAQPFRPQPFPGMPGMGMPGMGFPGMPGNQVNPGDYKSNSLINGVKNGSLNKQEFNSLNMYNLETERLREQMSKDGLSRKEQKTLNRREKQYNKMYEKYSHGDYHPTTNARNDIQQRQLGQSSSIYDGLSNGSITRGEGNHLLGNQKGIAGQMGRFQQYGGINPWERGTLHNMLNQSGRQINGAQNNWARDFRPPFMKMFNMAMMF